MPVDFDKLVEAGICEPVGDERGEREPPEPINRKTLQWAEIFVVADRIQKIPCPKYGKQHSSVPITCETCPYRRKCKRLNARYNKMLEIMGDTTLGEDGNREE